MLRFLCFALAVVVLMSATIPTYASLNGNESPLASRQLSVSEVQSTAMGARFSVQAAASEPASETEFDPRVDILARPFSAGLLWVLPTGTNGVIVEAIPRAWRSPEVGEIGDSLIDATLNSPLPLATSSTPAIMRGIPLATFSFNALQPSEDGHSVRICTDYQVRVDYQRSDAPVQMRKLSATFMDMVASVAGNLDELPPIPARRPEPYLVIFRSGASLVPIQNFANWKRQRGHTVTVASTEETGPAKEQIYNYILNAYNTWDEPPVFVVLIGDASGSYPIPTFFIDGTYTPLICTDHPYAMLEGDDYLPEVLVGRLSFGGESDLSTIVAKTVNYEKTPFEPDGAWRTRALMVGVTDYYGSYTSAWPTKLWVRDRLLEHGYTDVGTVSWPGGTAFQIRQQINTGVSFVNYRGFGSPEGWSMPSYLVGDIGDLTNGWKLPVVTSMVCGGGDFVAGGGPCFGEAWIRYGTQQNPKGAVAFCGPSEHDTKTRWNNTLDAGIYFGILYEGINTFGAALLRGKMELMRQFPQNLAPGTSDNSVHFYFHTYNILGDPGLTFFVGTPKPLQANFPTTVPLGQPTIGVYAASGGAPLTEAWATVTANGALFSRGITDAEGNLSLPIPQSSADSATITVTKPLYRPAIQTIALTPSPAAFVSATSTDFADDGSHGSSGNGDGTANPGEIIALQPHLHNFGNTSFGGGDVILRALQSMATVLDSIQVVPTIAPGADALPGYVNFQIRDDVPDDAILRFEWGIDPYEIVWSQGIEIYGPTLQVHSMQVGGEYRPLNPGETASVSLMLDNVGRAPLPATTAALRSMSSGIIVLDSAATFDDIPAGDSTLCSGDGFELQVSNDLIAGDEVAMLLVIYVGEGQIHVPFSVTIGQIQETDPTPPDEYGYRAYEDTDTGYDEAPTLAWVEINPAEGGPGTVLSLSDVAEGDDHSLIVSLPIAFKYYGEIYSEITVCTNGWIAMGRTTRVDFRNYALPAPLSPLTLIAPFWDDLITGAQGRICSWYDVVGHRFIVEWSHVQLLHGAQEQNFQVILFDASCWPTATGDGEILFQYGEISNSDSYDNFATVGIQKPDLTTAVLITHAGIPSPGTASLRSNKAILITTGRPTSEAYLRWTGVTIDDDTNGGSHGNGDGIAQNGETVELTFLIQNMGGMTSPAATGVLRESDAYAVLLDTAITLPSIDPDETHATSPAVRVQILPTCPNGRAINFLLALNGTVGPCVMLPSLTVTGPLLSILPAQINDENGNSEFNPGERIELTPRVVNMGGSPAYSVTATVQRVSGPASVVDASATIGDVDIGEETLASDPVAIQVSAYADNGEHIVLRFTVRDQYGTEWRREDTYMVVIPVLVPARARVTDPPPGGNGDGFLLPGETGQLYLIVANTGFGTATNVRATLHSMDPEVVLLGEETVIGTVSGNSECEAETPIEAVVSSTAQTPSVARISVSLQADDDISSEGDIYLTLGNAYFLNDFENPYTSNWGHVGDHDLWHLQTHSSASPTHAFYFGQDASQTYPVLSQGSLFSTSFPFDGDGRIVFKTRYHTQPERDYCRVDLQIGITSWMNLIILSGHQDEWTEITLPVENCPPYASSRLRFTFQSDASVNDEGFYLDDVAVFDDVISDAYESILPATPSDFVLEQNWPNPFNNRTSFRFGLPSKGHARIAIYDILGRQVAVLVDEDKTPGLYEVGWNPKEMASGVYFVRLEAASVVRVRKVLLLK